ncbi:hypothetical protein M431DRAFT_197112 [Trichoderma harzianum CBS 226.95]|uniref:Uncharacterized protein n=1 Tax=Trichoderma harzianum CBS 226.95 TaxID=983964 RepID=A0A2T4AUR9_TRIHA|nr:hypothetical protein M431DRAFT_197112 [Trichoderma harzianum CBS 226.95]PTB60814.1 hypothetical protein M431DRAFT_197112 [Trichoderma harzianum CBS 226.95]
MQAKLTSQTEHRKRNKHFRFPTESPPRQRRSRRFASSPKTALSFEIGVRRTEAQLVRGTLTQTLYTHRAQQKIAGASFRATSVWGVSPERHQGSFRLNGFCPPAPLFARRRRNLLKKLWGSPKRENETKRLQGRCDVTTTVAGKRAEAVFPSDEPSQLVGYGCFVLTLRYLWAGESQARGPPL